VTFRSTVVATLAALAGSATAFAQTATLAPGSTVLSTTGGNVAITFNATFTGAPALYVLTVTIPPGWTYRSGTGEPELKPAVGDQQTLSWLNVSSVASPVQFAFTVSYPASVTAATVTSAVTLRQNGVRTDLTPAAVVFSVASSSGGGSSGGGTLSGGGSSSTGGGSGGGGSTGGGTGGSTSVLPSITTQPLSQAVNAGANVTFTVVANFTSPLTYLWRKDGIPIYTSSGPTLTLPNVQMTDAGGYFVVVSSSTSSATSITAVLTVSLPPTILTQPVSPISTMAGSPVVLSATAVGTAGSAPPAYQWRRDGNAVTGATSPTLSLANLQPQDAGIYTAVVTAGGTATTAPAIVGVTTTSEVIGNGSVFGTNIVHPNGNIFDQVLLTGAAESLTAPPGRITRTSFIDPSDDIVQVELSGAGTVSVVLDSPSGPALPVNYNQAQPYMKGRAGIVITNADETSNLSVFTVGRATAWDLTGAFNILLPVSATNNPANNGSPLFVGHTSTVYDGIADIAYIAILSTDGRFGGLRTADVRYSAGAGLTGVYAPGVQFTGPVFVGNIDATGTASPVLIVGSAGDARITGGDLLQANVQPVQVSGVTQLKFTAGQDSNGNALPSQTNKAILQQGGTDVTAAIVVNPGL
jgi:hypothetical protein